MIKKVLIVRKMSALEYYYKGSHKSKAIIESARNHDNNVNLIQEILKENNVKFELVTRRELTEQLIEKFDAVISAGGDGTVIATAFHNKNTPQLNLRTDNKSVGALCLADIKTSIEKFLAGKYQIESWTRQDVYLDNKLLGRASNETCVGEQLKFSKLAKFDLSYENHKESLSGSGLVIVTGTGSSAWPAAFSAFPRNSDYFEFRVILKHYGNTDHGKANSFLVDYKGHEGKVAIDTMEFDLPRDSQLKIELSKFPLKVIVPL